MLAKMFNADWHMKNRRDDKVMIIEPSSFLSVSACGSPHCDAYARAVPAVANR